MRFRLLILLICTSCVHTDRKPASESKLPVSVTCDQAFQNLGEEKVVSRGEDREQRYKSIIGQIRYLQDAYIPEFKKKISNLESQKGCAREDVIGEFNRLIEGWKSFMRADIGRKALLKQTKTALKGSPFFHDPKYAQKLSCVFTCPDPEKCISKCKASGYKEIDTIFNLRKLGLECSSDSAQGKVFNSNIFQSNFAKYVPTVFSHQQRNAVLIQQMLEVSQQLERAIQPVAKKMKQLRPDEKSCVREPVELAKKMEPFVTQIESGAGNGSGFLVKSENQIKVITAYHVFSYNSELTFANQKVELFGKEHIFKINRNNFDRMADIFYSDFTEERPALTLASQGRLPVKGQKFYALGFPRNGESLRFVPCTFYGFTQASEGHGTRYMLSCDGGLLHIDGLSGGPIVDETGTVWGVSINTGVLSSSHMTASPVYQDSQGKFAVGLPHYETSDLCVKPDNWSVRERCQLVENQYETQIP